MSKGYKNGHMVIEKILTLPDVLINAIFSYLSLHPVAELIDFMTNETYGKSKNDYHPFYPFYLKCWYPSYSRRYSFYDWYFRIVRPKVLESIFPKSKKNAYCFHNNYRLTPKFLLVVWDYEIHDMVS